MPWFDALYAICHVVSLYAPWYVAFCVVCHPDMYALRFDARIRPACHATVLQSDCSSLAAPKAKPPAQNSAQMRKMINDTFARRKAEKMALPAPFSQADLEQPEAGTLCCLFSVFFLEC